MINIEVVSFNNQPLAQPLSAEFDEMGGNIGRSDNNTLVLPDPERYISRTHATVVYRAGGYVLRDQGTATPVYVNEKPLGNGEEAPIRVGDEIRIGGYVALVTASAQQTPGITGPEKTVIKDAADPLSIFGRAARGSDPFAPFSPAPRKSSAAPGAAKPMDDPFAIPADYDPLTDRSDKRESPVDALGLVPSPESQSIDELFKLGSGANNDPLGLRDPFAAPGSAGSDLSTDPLAVLGFAAKARSDGAHSQRDDTPALHGSLRVPQPRSDASQKVPDAEPPARAELPGRSATVPQAPGPAADTEGAVLSWESGDSSSGAGEIRTMIVRSPGSSVPRGESAAPIAPPFPDVPVLRETSAEASESQRGAALTKESERLQASKKEPSPEPRVPVARQALEVTEEAAKEAKKEAAEAVSPAPSAAASPAAEVRAGGQPATRSAPPDSSEREQLLRAFLEGAGVPELNLPSGLTPEIMAMFGRLLREATQGTLDLLLARALAKREVRAEMTMIVPRENNPLKFSPSVEVALSHLLMPQGRGFMTPLRAMKDAYNDLRSHQMGFLAGMQAALAGVLARFDPAQLEKRLTQKSLVDSFVPQNRRARLWDLFTEIYGDISKEAEDDFHALFGKEFVRAYEAQIAKLEQEDQDGAREQR